MSSLDGVTSIADGEREAFAGAAGIRKVAVVLGMVTPYTNRLYEEIAAQSGIELRVFACTDIEPGRQWTLPPAQRYSRRVLSGLRWHRTYLSHVYLNPSIVPALFAYRPDVVVISDFSPTMLFAALTARLMGKSVALASDTQPDTDPGANSGLHRLARRLIVPLATAGVGGSEGTREVFTRYGLGRERTVVCPVVPGWDYHGDAPSFEERPYDLLFCGHIDEERKGALFFLETVKRLHQRGRRLSVRIVGDGPLRARLEREFATSGIDARFDGYLQQDQLAEAYLSARLFLFPSRGDPWGLVANEAAQCGTPTIVSPHAQAAHELVVPYGCGSVVELEEDRWADEVERYLDDPSPWLRAQSGGVASRGAFSLQQAARNYLKAMAIARGRPKVRS
ncbi:glycosyltransferase family 4 protein [Aquamicrobium sp. LC103]|uniref:glycosyltransferase family 4 protein n=1 Tax=Aquamicrobium sp. LC103 TaxID=1120658 RepID=UPI00069A7F12|nr:glycosyltransferase family 4 protein [Aquamicrobium sp. LC103]TKT77456.1 glycosyltransferase family 4 protein [Aquamicrobium sp. LC103]